MILWSYHVYIIAVFCAVAGCDLVVFYRSLEIIFVTETVIKKRKKKNNND